MTSVTYTQARAKFKSYCDEACDNAVPIIVERNRGEDVVIVSRQEYESLQETAYLLQSPANAKRLEQSLKDVDVGRVMEYDPTLE